MDIFASLTGFLHTHLESGAATGSSRRMTPASLACRAWRRLPAAADSKTWRRLRIGGGICSPLDVVSRLEWSSGTLNAADTSTYSEIKRDSLNTISNPKMIFFFWIGILSWRFLPDCHRQGGKLWISWVEWHLLIHLFAGIYTKTCTAAKGLGPSAELHEHTHISTSQWWWHVLVSGWEPGCNVNWRLRWHKKRLLNQTYFMGVVQFGSLNID